MLHLFDTVLSRAHPWLSWILERDIPNPVSRVHPPSLSSSASSSEQSTLKNLKLFEHEYVDHIIELTQSISTLERPRLNEHRESEPEDVQTRHLSEMSKYLESAQREITEMHREIQNKHKLHDGFDGAFESTKTKELQIENQRLKEVISGLMMDVAANKETEREPEDDKQEKSGFSLLWWMAVMLSMSPWIFICRCYCSHSMLARTAYPWNDKLVLFQSMHTLQMHRIQKLEETGKVQNGEYREYTQQTESRDYKQCLCRNQCVHALSGSNGTPLLCIVSKSEMVFAQRNEAMEATQWYTATKQQVWSGLNVINENNLNWI